MKIMHLVLIGLLVNSPIWAMHQRSIQPDQTLTLSIARHQLTRLSIQGERIVSLHSVGEPYRYQMDKDSGALWIAPKGKHQISVFVSTHQHHYLLQLIPAPLPSDTWILIPPKPSLTQTLTQMLHGHAPQGWFKISDHAYSRPHQLLTRAFRQQLPCYVEGNTLAIGIKKVSQGRYQIIRIQGL